MGYVENKGKEYIKEDEEEEENEEFHLGDQGYTNREVEGEVEE